MCAKMASAPYLRTPLPSCSIVVDRHTHKNGGSTMRDLFMRNELLDAWMYWGYGLAHVERVVDGLLQLLLGSSNRSCTDWAGRPALRLAAELHYSYMTAETLLATFGPFSPLRQLGADGGPGVLSNHVMHVDPREGLAQAQVPVDQRKRVAAQFHLE